MPILKEGVPEGMTPIDESLRDAILGEVLSGLGIPNQDDQESQVMVNPEGGHALVVDFTHGGYDYGEENGIFRPGFKKMEEVVAKVKELIKDTDIESFKLRGWEGTEFRMTTIEEEGKEGDFETEWEPLSLPSGVWASIVVSPEFAESLGTTDLEEIGLLTQLGLGDIETNVELALIADTHFGVEIHDPNKQIGEISGLADELMRRVESKLAYDETGTVWVMPHNIEEYS